MKVGSVEKDARVLYQSGDDFPILFHSRGALAAPTLELPLIVGEAFRGFFDPALIHLVSKVGAVTAAALHEFGSGSGEYTLAPIAEYARPVAFEERHVEHPGALYIIVFKTDPLVGINWYTSHSQNLVRVRCRVRHL